MAALIFYISVICIYSKRQREKCDYLIVGLNSDLSVRKLKGPENRPINDQITRCATLEAIEYIDEVYNF